MCVGDNFKSSLVVEEGEFSDTFRGDEVVGLCFEVVLADAEEPLDEEDYAGEGFLAEGEHLFDDEDVGVDFGCGVGLLDEARDESIRVP